MNVREARRWPHPDDKRQRIAERFDEQFVKIGDEYMRMALESVPGNNPLRYLIPLLPLDEGVES